MTQRRTILPLQPVSPTGGSIAPFRTFKLKTAPVLSYDKNDPFYEFTMFSPHDVIYKGKRYPTSEHLFQAFKVRVVSSSLIDADVGPCTLVSMTIRLVSGRPSRDRRVVGIVMDIALRLKYTQHRDLKALLLGTGDAHLVEVRGVLSFRSGLGFNRFWDFPRNYFWGIGADRSGRNKLGKVIVRFREELVQRAYFSPHIFIILTSHILRLLSQFCRSKPRFGREPYCSRTCAAKAGGALQSPEVVIYFMEHVCVIYAEHMTGYE